MINGYNNNSNFYEQLVQLLMDVTYAHAGVEYVRFGQVAEANNDKQLRFPFCNITPLPCEIATDKIVYTFEFVLADQNKKDNSNRLSIFSNLLQIGSEIIRYIEFIDILVNYSITSTPFLDDFDGECCGVIFNLSFTELNNPDTCNFPLKEGQILPTSLTQISPHHSGMPLFDNNNNAHLVEK